MVSPRSFFRSSFVGASVTRQGYAEATIAHPLVHPNPLPHPPMSHSNSPTRFSDRLFDAINRSGSPICVGLDPVLESLDADLRARHHEPLRAIEEFCKGVISAITPDGQPPIAPIIKLQSACFERYGSKGVLVLEHTALFAKQRGLLVLLDAKRGDIGISAAHYAASALHLGADSVTVNAYLGPSGVAPFLDAGLGVFALVRTSNPDSDTVQNLKLADGRTVAEMMADQVVALGNARTGTNNFSDIGAVVGATKPADGAALRARMPNQFFLMPGYGAQGGTAADVRAMLRANSATSAASGGVLVTASRSVIYPKPTTPTATWTDNIRAAATTFAAEVRSVVLT